jgi:hypothetical protein
LNKPKEANLINTANLSVTFYRLNTLIEHVNVFVWGADESGNQWKHRWMQEF